MREIIKHWDLNVVNRHIINDVKTIKEYFKEKNINNISMIDVGANVGKIYDNLNIDINIEKCIMIEPVKQLYDYLKEKYKDDPKVEIYNFAISDNPGNFKMYEEAFEDDITISSNYINLGVCRLSETPGDTVCITMNEFLENYLTLDPSKLSFIKIDTESKDFVVIKQLTDYIKKNKITPYITFEKNYFYYFTIEQAQSIINTFCSECNYYNFDLASIPNDYFLKPI